MISAMKQNNIEIISPKRSIEQRSSSAMYFLSGTKFDYARQDERWK